MGQLDEAAAEARTALDLARRIGYAEGEARALVNLSDIAMYADQGEEAVAWAGRRGRYPSDRIPAWFARRIDSSLAWALVFNDELDGVRGAVRSVPGRGQDRGRPERSRRTPCS